VQKCKSLLEIFYMVSTLDFLYILGSRLKNDFHKSLDYTFLSNKVMIKFQNLIVRTIVLKYSGHAM
jgi:hypothetical protein